MLRKAVVLELLKKIEDDLDIIGNLCGAEICADCVEDAKIYIKKIRDVLNAEEQ